MANAIIDMQPTRHDEHLEQLEDLAPPAPVPFSHASFVRWLVGSTLGALLAIAGFVWYVDPTGVTGRVTPWRVAENAEVRSEKLDLYERLVSSGEAPEVVLLGSSRTMKFDPADVHRLTGDRAFNAAVSGGVPHDAWLFVRLLQERQEDRFPHLVWGLDIDAFREKQLRDGLATDPRMARFLGWSDRLENAVATAGSLTELQTVKAAVSAVREGPREPGQARRADPPEPFTEHGFQVWSRPLPRRQPARERAVREQVAEYASYVFERDAYRRVEREPLEEFRDVVRIANAHGDVPTIFLTPYHPLAEQLLARHDLAAREREVIDTLRRLQHEGLRFELVDLTELESFGGDPAQFYDGVHMSPANTRRALERLHRDGVLGR